MELRHTFNEDAINYDRARPGYVSALFEDILKYRPLDKDSQALEIGIGTGQATEPFLKTGCTLTAVEIGDSLADLSRDKFHRYDHFQVIQADFMDVPLSDDSLDIVYSATAFHWLPQQQALQKIKRSLKNGGAIALFWNHPYPNRWEDPSNVINRRVYAKYRPSDCEIRENTDTEPRARMLMDAGFSDVSVHLYSRVRTLSTEKYIALLNTYSDHRAMPEVIRHAFEEDMRAGLTEVGGHINIYDTQALYLGRK